MRQVVRAAGLGILLAVFAIGGVNSLGQDSSDAFFSHPAEVVRVIDGDTFDVMWPNGTIETVRPAGIDSAEMHTSPSVSEPQCFAIEATEYATSLLLNRTIWLDEAPDGPRDQFDRLLARVHLDSSETSSFNKLMVSQGFAVADERFPVGEALQPLEEEARDANRGLWGSCIRSNDAADEETSENVVIAAVMPRPDGPEPDEEWIQICNDAGETVDIGRWTISDGEKRSEYRLGEGDKDTRLKFGQCITIYGSEFNPTRDGNALFLSNSGDTVFLRNEVGDLVDRVSYTDARVEEVIRCDG